MKQVKSALMTLLLAQGACLGGPSLVREPAGDYLQANAPAEVWATLVDGERLMITGPRVISDTIFGWSGGEEITLPIAEVKEIKTRKISILRSSLMPAAVFGAGVAAVILTSKPQGEPMRDVTQECEDTGGMCDPSMMQGPE